jgi:uncharacterized surface protein with fasciclin (FAS1) repeats
MRPARPSVLAVLVAAGLPLVPAALAGPPATAAAPGKDIFGVAASAGTFRTLAAAVAAAGLAETLQGPGPFTVFAPTDEAFARLPEGKLETLLKPENKDVLRSIILYHVVAESLPAKGVVALGGAVTANGQRLDFSERKGVVKVDGATVVRADVKASNGVIHAIDAVLIPALDSIAATAVSAGTFETLLAAARAAGLADALAGPGPLTVFAPTDEAFGRLPPGTIDSLLQPANKDQLAAILELHIVSGRVYSADAAKAKTAKSLLGQPLAFSGKGDAFTVNGARIVKADLDASNGVIHVIDTVTLPSG